MHLHALLAILEKRQSKLFCSVLPFNAFQHVFFQKKKTPRKAKSSTSGTCLLQDIYVGVSWHSQADI